MLTLVLLPGMDGTGIFFEDFAAVAQPEFDPVIVRYPDDPSRGYAGLEPVARAALPRDKPFLILGESFSGPIAISIAASNPPGLVGSDGNNEDQSGAGDLTSDPLRGWQNDPPNNTSNRGGGGGGFWGN